MTEPLPCPFCGGSHVSVVDGDTFRWRFAECQNCGAGGPDVRVKTIGEGTPREWEDDARARAIAEWNRRASPWRPMSECLDDNTFVFYRNPDIIAIGYGWHALKFNERYKSGCAWMPIPAYSEVGK